MVKQEIHSTKLYTQIIDTFWAAASRALTIQKKKKVSIIGLLTKAERKSRMIQISLKIHQILDNIYIKHERNSRSQNPKANQFVIYITYIVHKIF